MTSLLDTIRLGDLVLPNRIAMAPVTRSRSGRDGVSTVDNAAYYAQRASAGLIVSEAVNVSANSAAFELAPGLYDTAQVAGWRRPPSTTTCTCCRPMARWRTASTAASQPRPPAP